MTCHRCGRTLDGLGCPPCRMVLVTTTTGHVAQSFAGKDHATRLLGPAPPYPDTVAVAPPS